MHPEVTHPLLGTYRVDGVPVRFSRTPAAIRRPGPLLGEANAEVYGGLLGRDDAEIEALAAAQVLW
jgi:crotonobetainyl-CoA:carnitine CoA-transferase CaiB-like acyl-CoA transferase